MLDYPHFKRSYKIISIDSSKQQALDADPRSIQQVIIIANLDGTGSTTTFFIIEEVRDFSQGTVKVLQICYRMN